MAFVAPILKHRISQATRTYSRTFHTANRPGDDPQRTAFIPGETTVPYAGRVFTEDEVQAAVSSTLDFWLTLGPEGEAFEKELAALLGVRHSLLVNSGSSANLVAFAPHPTSALPRNDIRRKVGCCPRPVENGSRCQSAIIPPVAPRYF
jgi:CDP-6-deoxy-D-xylo-4-hexulose-3-dehydrase